MALGSSAPEILLAVIETISSLGSCPGELGASTIVGSAAFNLLIISAVSIYAVSKETDKDEDDPERDQDVEPGIKRIFDLGVFAVTATASVLAYVWMWFVLKDQIVEIWEGVVTFSFFFLLIGTSYAADRLKANNEEDDESSDVPFTAAEMYATLLKEKQESKKQSPEDMRKSQEMKKILEKNFETTDISQVPFEQLQKKFDKQSLVTRLQYRKAPVAIRNSRTIAKGEKFKFEHAHASNFEDKSDLNPNFGFKCLHYSISEAFGKIKVPILNKSGQ